MLSVRSISKNFNGETVLNNVSFEVKAGEVLALLGNNGAGKTTLLRVLSGLTTPDLGEVEHNGVVLKKSPRDFKRRLGFVPDEPSLYPNLTVRETIELSAKIMGVASEVIREKTDRLIESLYLQPYVDKRIKQLSRGNRQKTQIAAALVHSPDLLILDEPIVGLDYESMSALHRIVRDFAAKGRVVVFSTHVLPIAESFSDRLFVLQNGMVTTALINTRVEETLYQKQAFRDLLLNEKG